MSIKLTEKSLCAGTVIFAPLGGAMYAQDTGTLDPERLIENPETKFAQRR